MGPPSAAEVGKTVQVASRNTSYRVRHIPINYSLKKTRDQLKKALKLNETSRLRIGSLAPDVENTDIQVATISFDGCSESLPARDQRNKQLNEWIVVLEVPENIHTSSAFEGTVTIDTHFHGFTPLNDPEDENNAFDLIAVCGLNGHAFGSFKQKDGEYMWLRDGIPNEAALSVRVIIYGYDSKLVGSTSFQGLGAIASTFRNRLKSVRRSSAFPERPIVFVGHSLGGLVIKQAIIQMAEGAERHHDKWDQNLLFASYALFFFGVPSRGMDIRSLMAMVHGQPNSPFISLLDRSSEFLATQHRDFCIAFPFEDSVVISFYETEKTPTAEQIDGKWEMIGPSEVLVDITSATQGRSLWESEPYFVQAINKNHQEMVKYSRGDEYYHLIKGRLEDVSEKAISTIHQRFQAHSPSSRLLIPPRLDTAAQSHMRAVQELPSGLIQMMGSLDGAGFPFYPEARSQEQRPFGLAMLNSSRSINSNEIQTRSEIEKQEREQELREDFLSRLEPSQTNLSAKPIPKRHQGTCEWVYDTTQYSEWMNSPLPQTLVITAPTGRGKSVLANYLSQQFQRDGDDTVVLSYFCKDNDHGRKRSMNIVRHLLYQLLDCKRELLRHLPRKALIMGRETVFTFQNLWDVLTQILRAHDLKNVFCIIDGLDECDEESSKTIQEAFDMDVLSGDLTAKPIRARFLITSQPTESALLLAQKSIDLKILPSSVNDDILKYVYGTIKSLKRLGSEMTISQQLSHHIQATIEQQAKGSFQWAKLVLKEIGDAPISRNSIMNVFQQAPKDLSGLYEECFRKISPYRILKARRMLTILLFSSRALTPVELAVCMLENPTQYTTHAQVEDDFDHSMAWEANVTCGSFLDLVDNSINITHQSARVALMSFTPEHRSSTDFIPFDAGEGHRILAMSCLSYLLLDEIQKLSTEDQHMGLGIKFPFLKYAEANWHVHLREVKDLEGFEVLLQRFFSPCHLRTRPWQSAWPHMLKSFPTWEGSEDTAIMHLLVHTGLLSLLKRCKLDPSGSQWTPLFTDLLSPWRDPSSNAEVQPRESLPLLILSAGVDNEDTYGDTPLLRAMKASSWDVFFWLLCDKLADPNTVNDEGCTIAHLAAKVGFPDLIRWLGLNRVRTNGIDGYGLTPLDYALICGSEKAAASLIKNTPPHDARFRESPLHLVARSGYQALLPIALSHSCGVNEATSLGKTAIMVASEHGHDNIVRALLAAHGDTDLKDNKHKSALHYAASKGSEKVVTTLLDHGVIADEPDDRKRTPLHLAASNGHEKMVLQLIPNVSDLDAQDERGWTALHYATEKHHLNIVKILVENEADINRASRDGWTPFHLASMLGYFDIANFLAAQSGVLLDTVNHNGFTPLASAALKRFEDIVLLLLSHNANVEGRVYSDANKKLWTPPLQAAARGGSQRVVKDLLGANALVNAVACDNSTALMCAAEEQHHEIVTLLLDHGANTNCKSNTGWSPLHCVTKDDQEELVTRLLDLGVDASSRDIFGWTPAHLACSNGSIRILEILVTRGANVEATSDAGWSLLHEAVKSGNEGMVRWLLSRKVRADQAFKGHITPLIVASGKENAAIVKLLLEYDASGQGIPSKGWSPLHAAARSGCQKNAVLLLNHRHPVDAMDKLGATPLLYAALGGHVLLVKVLLKHNANIKAISRTGLSFLNCAVAAGSKALVQLGIEKGVDINWSGPRSDPAIFEAIGQGNRELFSILLSHNARLSIRSRFGQSALHQAASSGYEGLVQDLLAAGLDPNARDKYGRTPLHLAAWCYRKATVRVLVAHGGDQRALDPFGRTAYYWARRRFNHGLTEKKHSSVPELESSHRRQRLEHTIRFCLDKLCQNITRSYQFSTLGKCLQFIGDTENAKIAFEQRMDQSLHPKLVHYASCNGCGLDKGIEGYRYVCSACADVDLCSECFSGSWKPGQLGRGCFAHKFLVVPRPGWELRPPTVVNDDGLTVLEWLTSLRPPRTTGLENEERRTWSRAEQQMQSRLGYWDLSDVIFGLSSDFKEQEDVDELLDI